jgi:hypothetical protein
VRIYHFHVVPASNRIGYYIEEAQLQRRVLTGELSLHIQPQNDSDLAPRKGLIKQRQAADDDGQENKTTGPGDACKWATRISMLVTVHLQSPVIVNGAQ